MNFKNIHIGSMIEKKVAESGIEVSRICNFLHCHEEDLLKTYKASEISTDTLLQWSKLLDYDFFRLYSQHLILYAPPGNQKSDKNKVSTQLPTFRKNIYTKEIIDFILEMIKTEQKTKMEIVQQYRIPKTTLYKWISKLQNSKSNE